MNLLSQTWSTAIMLAAARRSAPTTGVMPQSNSDVLWDVEWVDADGTPLEQRQHQPWDDAESQAQQWLRDKPGSRVYLYQRRGEIRVLVQVKSEGQQETA